MTRAIDIHREALDARQAIVPVQVDGTEGVEDRLDFSTLLTTLRRNLRLFIGIFVTILLATVVITLTQQKRFAATSEIVVSLEPTQIAPQAVGAPQQTQQPSDQVDTEVKILTSRDLADRVVTALKLEQDPDYNLALGPLPSGIRARIKSLLGMGPSTAPVSPEQLRREVIDRVLDNLQVTRSGETLAVDITATAAKAIDAQRIADEYARQYIESRVQSKLDDSQLATNFLSSRLDELRGQAHADMERVQQYRIAHNLLSTTGASLTEQEISAYNQSVANAKEQAAEDLARLDTARAQLRSGSNGDDVGEALGSSVVSTLRARQAEVSGRLAVLQSRYNDSHPEVIKAKSELADVNGAIQAEITRVISNLEAKVKVSRERQDSIEGSLANARGTLAQNNQAMTDLDDLERRATASQALYESYLSRYKEISAEGGTERPGAHLISGAELPLDPSSPNVKLNLILGTFLGLGAGIAGAFIAELLFSGLTTGKEVEERLGLPYLAGVPTLPSGMNSKNEASDSVVQNPRSIFAEAFRTLRAALVYSGPSAPRVIAICSSLPKEGKTTISTCLARMIAQGGDSVILLDCDRRHARLSRQIVGGKRDVGLLELLSGTATFEEATVQDSVTSLTILPLSGIDHDVDELLTGDAMMKLLDELRAQYSFIILDTAPVLPVAETRIIAAMADAVIFVARWRHTPDHAVRAALRLLPTKHARIAGVILSRIDLKRQMRFARGDASYYYKHYKHYYAS